VTKADAVCDALALSLTTATRFTPPPFCPLTPQCTRLIFHRGILCREERASLGSNADQLRMDGNVVTGDELVPTYQGFSEGLVSIS